MDTLIFKTIPGYSRYEIDQYGNVKNKISGKIKKFYIRDNGYCTIHLINNVGETKHCYIHRLLFTAHSGIIPNGYEIDHIDRNRANNKLENLRLLKHKDNVRNSFYKRGLILMNKYCSNCGVRINKKTKNYCLRCTCILRRKTLPVTKEELELLIKTNSLESIGRMFNVTGNAIKKWCVRYGLKTKRSYIPRINDNS